MRFAYLMSIARIFLPVGLVFAVAVAANPAAAQSTGCATPALGRKADGGALPGYLCPGNNACVPCTLLCGHPSSVVDGNREGSTDKPQYDAARQVFSGRMPQWPGSGTNYRPDSATLEQACNLAGFRSHVSNTAKSWRSPGDNYLIYWDNGQRRFVKGNGAALGGRWAGSIKCKGLLHPSCRGPSNLGWVFNPPKQCADGIDNDGDGLVDQADLGCGSADDDSENSATSQCQDGIDNDGDGAKDFPADFGCSSRTDNNEGDPKSQCQNGVDDDGDGLSDTLDPGCSSNQDNNEGDGTSQCQDGIDNDGDGVKDFPADFSCSSATDNDETNSKSQCQNGADDDGDGLSDSVDPGCASQQDNNEGDEPARFTVGLECVTKNSDNSTTAYFTYNNVTGSAIDIATANNRSTENTFTVVSSGGVSQSLVPPSRFKAGLNKGEVAVTYSGQGVVWNVRALGSAAASAVASTTSPLCATLTPRAECQGFSKGAVKIVFGYTNANPFALQFPIGVDNKFAPGLQDRGQPTQFFAGNNSGAFDVTASSNNQQLEWVVNGKKTTASGSLPICAGSCIETPTGTVTGQLDDVARQLSGLMDRAANLLASAKAPRGGSSRNRLDAQRAKTKAAQYEKKAREITIGVPSVVRSCPEAPAFCSTIDRSQSIEELRGLYAVQLNSIRRVVARTYFRNTGATRRGDSLVNQAKALRSKGEEALKGLPRFSTACN